MPATYQTATEQVLKSEASERIEVSPARYEWVEERVLLREESVHVEVVPATYKSVTETVMVQPESEIVEIVPAVYGTETEQDLVKPAYTTWKKGRGPMERIDEATGEIMCLVEIPAEYKSVSRQVLKTPATTRSISVPAEYKTITRQAVDTSATTRSVKIPAEYGTVKVRKLVEATKERRIAIPAVYQTVSKTEQISEGHLEWRAILCETNTTPGLVTRIQNALAVKGYNPGKIDGVLGHETMQAVNAFQLGNDMVSGQLTMETVEALGVDL